MITKNKITSGYRSLYSFVTMLIILLLIVSGCKDAKSPFNASGRPLEVVVVIPDEYYTSAVKDSVRGALGEPYTLLPQIEPACDVIFTKSSKFNNLFKIFRNILYVDINPSKYTKATFNLSKDEFATGQLIVTFNSPDLKTFYQVLDKHKTFLSNLYYQQEIKSKIVVLMKTYSSAMKKMVEDSIPGMTINPPVKIKYLRGHKNFVWGSNLSNEARTDIVVYEYPYTNSSDFNLDKLIHKRDSVMMTYILGEYKDSYMSTEKRISPLYKVLNLNGEYRAEVRGLWAMVGDMMGGPFVMHATLDPKHEHIVVAEAFIYAPSKKKRNYMLDAEACLYTLRPKGEVIKPDSLFLRNRSVVNK